MRTLLLILTLLLGTNADFNWEYENDVLVLDEGSLPAAKSNFDYLMLEFYAPWCGHCQKLAPEYEKAATALKEEGIALGKVDASVHRKLAEAEGVNGYPTLKFLTQGKEVKFDGGRTADGIQQWIWSHINPGSEELTTLNEITEAISSNDNLFFYFADGEVEGKDREFRRYKEFAYTVRATKFAHTTLKGAREHFKVPKTTNFVVFKKNDQKLSTYSSTKLKIQDLKTFVEINSHPRILTFENDQSFLEQKIFTKDKPSVILFETENNNELQAFRDAALAYPTDEYLLFILINQNSEFKQSIINRLQIKESDAQGVFLVTKNGQLKFRMNTENVKQFIQDWKDGKATRYLKSEDVEVSSGPVQTLSLQSYLDLTQQQTKDVIILYYIANNEEHQVVLKQYEQIALRLYKNGIIFGKIDLNKNEVPDMSDSIDVTKIRLYKGEQKREFVKFVLKANKLQEERLVKWIRDNARNVVQDPKGDL